MDRALDVIRVLIADAQVADRRRLSRILQSVPRFRVLGEVPDACSVSALIGTLKPDILVLDLTILRRLQPDVLNGAMDSSRSPRVVVTVSELSRAGVTDAVVLGAHGLVLKATAKRELSKSIQSAFAGQFWFASESFELLRTTLREVLSSRSSEGLPNGNCLSPRELEIVTRIVRGHSNKQVGQECSISERTVKHHLTRIFGKVGVSSRLELAMFAVNHNIVTGVDASCLARVSGVVAHRDGRATA
jgi:DNA-binding NarL/FixJ family response regulator